MRWPAWELMTFWTFTLSGLAALTAMEAGLKEAAEDSSDEERPSAAAVSVPAADNGEDEEGEGEEESSEEESDADEEEEEVEAPVAGETLGTGGVAPATQDTAAALPGSGLLAGQTSALDCPVLAPFMTGA